MEIPANLPQLLLRWYQENKRDLPWRRDDEPYHVWVSEIMLQQTRVEAVKGYYARFLEALPTVADLAACDDDRLHKLWEGLGYYSRVRNMKKCASVLVQCYGGRFPRNYDAIRALPGIGDYTAGAICSICFDMPTPAVDGNVLRVISRLLDDATPIDLPAQKKLVQQSLASVYPREAGSFTQALMELGATVCGPNRSPDCKNCPCSDICLATERGTAEALPVKSPKKGRREEERTVLILRCKDRYAVTRRPESGLLAGLWQLPDVAGKLEAVQVLQLLDELGASPRELLRQADKQHIFTHVQWSLRGFYLEVAACPERWQWFTEEEIRKNVALPTAYRQFWEERI